MFINKSFIKLTVQTSLKLTCSNFHVSLQLNAGKLWRQKVGLSKLQTARGPLTDLPDFSFLGKFRWVFLVPNHALMVLSEIYFQDGRPTPLSVGQVRRKELQEKLAVRIIKIHFCFFSLNLFVFNI